MINSETLRVAVHSDWCSDQLIFGVRLGTYGMITRIALVNEDLNGTPGVNRTRDTRFRKPLLYPLSYRGMLTILSLELVDWQL